MDYLAGQEEILLFASGEIMATNAIEIFLFLLVTTFETG